MRRDFYALHEHCDPALIEVGGNALFYNPRYNYMTEKAAIDLFARGL
jgi:hypothetical protein